MKSLKHKSVKTHYGYGYKKVLYVIIASVHPSAGTTYIQRGRLPCGAGKVFLCFLCFCALVFSVIMLIGAHISAAGGVQNAPANAHKISCEVFQFFSRSPRGGKAPELWVRDVRVFRESMKKYGQKECYIHAPYYINLASPKNNIYFGSISVLREELERGTKLGAKYMMTHLGSAKDLGAKEAIKKVVQAIKKILDGYNGSCQFLIEMSAGTGMIIGDRFEEIAEIIGKIEGRDEDCLSAGQTALPRLYNKIGICYDTAHAFESGYDIRNQESVKKTFDEFDKIIGIDRLNLIHVNDSKTELGSHVDRHEHLGFGKIGLVGFSALMKDKRLKNINLILETPTNEGIVRDIKLLKKIRKKI